MLVTLDKNILVLNPQSADSGLGSGYRHVLGYNPSLTILTGMGTDLLCNWTPLLEWPISGFLLSSQILMEKREGFCDLARISRTLGDGGGIPFVPTSRWCCRLLAWKSALSRTSQTMWSPALIRQMIMQWLCFLSSSMRSEILLMSRLALTWNLVGCVCGNHL